MTTLYWRTQGEGKLDLVLLHGWGLNAEVWGDIVSRLNAHFRLHLVDLPGYGRSKGYPALPLAEIADVLHAQAPQRAIWLGWSLGGLVAMQFARTYPHRVSQLITVASSPCFAERDDWPGIKPEIFSQFRQQLTHDYSHTVERFLALQTLGTKNACDDVRLLKEIVLSQPSPAVDVLEGGLAILCHADFRSELSSLMMPTLRLYGHLDGLVPRRIVPILDKRWSSSQSVVIKQASHAPFISHPELFCKCLLDFVLIKP
ncbi:pimeloyl-ACP methyl ester esterase BioH [Enterobacteriaceae bacterium LUAb1]